MAAQASKISYYLPVINKDLLFGEEEDCSIPVQCLQDKANHYSPIKKLERLLAGVNSIYTIGTVTNVSGV